MNNYVIDSVTIKGDVEELMSELKKAGWVNLLRCLSGNFGDANIPSIVGFRPMTQTEIDETKHILDTSIN